MRRALIAMILCAACGGTHRPGSIGRSGGDPTGEQVAEGAVELALRRPDGQFIDVGDLRGRVVLLFVFATFDAMSQLVLHPLRALAEESPNLRIIGIAAQPNARLLVDAYVHALSPPFPVTYDPEERVQAGQSSLGAIDAVPAFIVLDRRGLPVARHYGFADAERLRELVGDAGN
jgi:hypothetical protein